MGGGCSVVLQPCPSASLLFWGPEPPNPPTCGLRPPRFSWGVPFLSHLGRFGLWPLAFGLWPLAFGLWPLAFGLWPLAFGLWPLVFLRHSFWLSGFLPFGFHLLG